MARTVVLLYLIKISFAYYFEKKIILARFTKKLIF